METPHRVEDSNKSLASQNEKLVNIVTTNNTPELPCNEDEILAKAKALNGICESSKKKNLHKRSISNGSLGLSEPKIISRRPPRKISLFHPGVYKKDVADLTKKTQRSSSVQNNPLQFAQQNLKNKICGTPELIQNIGVLKNPEKGEKLVWLNIKRN